MRDGWSNLESLLAAHGSGAVELSRNGDEPTLNIDIGGGTTKFAVCRGGRVEETAAIHLGARLLAWNDALVFTRVEDAGRRLAAAAGIAGPLTVGGRAVPDDLDRLAGHMAESILRIVAGDRQSDLWITPPLSAAPPFRRIQFSGGVAEYIYNREHRDFRDLGPRLAQDLRRGVDARGLQMLTPTEAIRQRALARHSTRFS